jgi:hypothetical protein
MSDFKAQAVEDIVDELRGEMLLLGEYEEDPGTLERAAQTILRLRAELRELAGAMETMDELCRDILVEVLNSHDAPPCDVCDRVVDLIEEVNGDTRCACLCGESEENDETASV